MDTKLLHHPCRTTWDCYEEHRRACRVALTEQGPRCPFWPPLDDMAGPYGLTRHSYRTFRGRIEGRRSPLHTDVLFEYPSERVGDVCKAPRSSPDGWRNRPLGWAS